MKVLYYNWIQFDKKNNSGGGVNVYQKNLIEEISKDKNNEVYFLSSGIYYNFFKKRPYIKETKNIFGDRCKTYKFNCYGASQDYGKRYRKLYKR